MALTPKQERFYVYTLSDPRDGQVFYVGKGCGNRAYQHEADAIRGSVGNIDKHSKIADIHKDGLSVAVAFVKRGMSETAAFRLERDEIRRIGIRNLTNIQPGTVSEFDRSKEMARVNLSRMKPHKLWLQEKPRSKRDIALALAVRAELQKIAENGCYLTASISSGGMVAFS